MVAVKQGIRPEHIKLFANDLEAYSKVCLSIRTKDAQIQKLVFNEEQRILNETAKKQYQETGRVRLIVLKARQVGVSTWASARIFRKLHLFPNQQAIVIADELDRSETLFGMYDKYAAFLPPEIRPMIRYSTKKKELFFDQPKDHLRQENPGLGSGIVVETAGDASAARSMTIQLAHLSEVADWPNAIELWVSLAQAIPDYDSEVYLESTAKGVGNFFHQQWLAAEVGEGLEDGENGFRAVFFPWWSHKEYTVKLPLKQSKMVKATLDDLEREYHEEGIEWRGERHKLTLGQIAWRRKTIREKTGGDPRAFQQEYPATPEEAFLVTGTAFFDGQVLKKYDASAEAPRRRCNIVLGPRSSILTPSDPLGYLRIWDEPDDKGQYVIAADTAQGRQVQSIVKRDKLLSDPTGEQGGTDFSSADVLNTRTRKQVAQLHGRMDPDIFADMLYLLGLLYSTKWDERYIPALIAVERNHSSGESVIQYLQEEKRYPNLYIRRRINRRNNVWSEEVGWMTSVETRLPMLDNLKRNIREQRIAVPSKESIREMMTFVRGEDGKPAATEGTHDDRVISLAIACWLMDHEVSELPKHLDDVNQPVSVGSSPTGMYTY